MRNNNKKFNVSFRKRISDTGDKPFINLQIGRGYETDEGHIDVIINSIPINWDGKVRLWLNRDDNSNDDEGDEE